MVTSLVMQSEDLSEDSIFNYAQFTEFAIRFGMMSERAASEESDERALLYELWCTLSRVHSDFAFIRVVNLKKIITVILGFPVAVHRNPADEKQKKKANKVKDKDAKNMDKERKPEACERNADQPDEDDESSGFDEADNDEIPSEDGDLTLEQNKNSRQPILTVEKSAGKVSRDTTEQSQSYYETTSLS